MVNLPLQALYEKIMQFSQSKFSYIKISSKNVKVNFQNQENSESAISGIINVTKVNEEKYCIEFTRLQGDNQIFNELFIEGREFIRA